VLILQCHCRQQSINGGQRFGVGWWGIQYYNCRLYVRFIFVEHFDGESVDGRKGRVMRISFQQDSGVSSGNGSKFQFGVVKPWFEKTSCMSSFHCDSHRQNDAWVTSRKCLKIHTLVLLIWCLQGLSTFPSLHAQNCQTCSAVHFLSGWHGWEWHVVETSSVQKICPIGPFCFA